MKVLYDLESHAKNGRCGLSRNEDIHRFLGKLVEKQTLGRYAMLNIDSHLIGKIKRLKRGDKNKKLLGLGKFSNFAILLSLENVAIYGC